MLASIYTFHFTDELQKLSDEGIGRLISRDRMLKDKFLPGNDCATVFMKPAPMVLTASFLRMANDKDCTEAFYTAQFHKDIDAKMKKMVQKYHPDLEFTMISQVAQSRNYFILKYNFPCIYGYICIYYFYT